MPQLDQLARPVKLVRGASIARDLDQDVRAIGGELESRDGVLHGLEGPEREIEHTELLIVAPSQGLADRIEELSDPFLIDRSSMA